MTQPSKKGYERSERYYEEARTLMPGGVSSNFRLGMKPLPLYFERAQGSRLYDADGNEYVDYALGMGPVILGHANPSVNDAVKASLEKGQLFAGQHEMELALARIFRKIVPCAEMVRFSLSGSEAVQAALRAARAFTGRRTIIKFEGHYHGWFDNVFVSVHPSEASMGPTASPATVPMSSGQDPNAYAETRILPWNDIEVFHQTVAQSGGDIAGIIMEPILCNTCVTLPKPGYMETVRKLCTQHGIVLIFDEVITGFRVALGGAQQFLGVTPDLAVFAKAMANGFPISCLAGRRDVMDLFGNKGVMHGGTYNTNLISCAAALATLRALQSDDSEAYTRLRKVGTTLMDGLREIAAETGCALHVQGLPAAFNTTFTEQGEITDYRSYRRCDLGLQSQLIAALLEQGVRITGRGTWFLSASHSDQDVEFTLNAARRALQALDRAGTIPKSG